MKSALRLKHTMLVMSLAAVYPLQGHAAAGVTQFASGDVTLRRGSATADPLTKGRSIESGDAIVTGPNGRAQVRFTDGGLVALQPNSQFNITRYADANDPKQDSFLVDLLRGGMRAVTGLIGKRNRENFKVTTTTATIGIRGSAFTLAYAPDGTLLVSTELDEIEVCTRAGCIGLTAGESARVVDPDQFAVRTNQRSSIVTPPPRQEPQVAANQITPAGTAAIVQITQAPPPLPGDPPAPPPVPGPPPPPPAPQPQVLEGVSFAGAYGYTYTSQPGFESTAAVVAGGVSTTSYDRGTLVIDAEGKPEYYLAQDNGKIQRTGATEVLHRSGTLAGNDFLLLGSWSAASYSPTANGASTDNYTPFAFVTGSSTSDASMAQMLGMTGTYALKHKTPIFGTEGLSGVLQDSSRLIAYFTGSSRAQVEAILDMSLTRGGYGSTQTLSGYLDVNGARMSGELSCQSESSCSTYGYAEGFFSGNGAEKVGLSYSGRSYDIGGEFGGAAIFERGATSPLPVDTYSYMAASFVSDTGASPFTIGSYSSGASAQFQGDALLNISYYGSNARNDGATVRSAGASGYPGSSDFIGWGYWSSGTRYSSGTTNLQNVHYVVGSPAAYLPTSGTYQFNVAGHTTPTSSQGTTGTFNSASLEVNFATAMAKGTVSTTFGTNAVNTLVENMSINGGRFAGSNTDSRINGILADYGYKGAFVYQTNTTHSGTISGAVGFTRPRDYTN